MKTHPHLEFIRRYARATQHAALSHDEKAAMRQQLLQHIKASSADVHSGGTPTPVSRVASPYLKYLKRAGKVVAPLMLVIVIGGGTSFAAESSLPGDLLYPVKIHVNENVVSGLSFSALSQAKWAVQKVKRRLAEVKAIGLQSAAKVGLDAAVAAQTDDAEAKISALDTSDPTDAGALIQQLAGLVQDDGINAPTSTDTTSTSPRPAVPAVVPPVTTSAHLKASTGAPANLHVTTNASASAPTVSTPTAPTPAITTPTVTSPTVSAPVVTVPPVSAPSVSVPAAASAAANAVTSVKSGLGL